jgi:hypothetical protein
VWEETYALDLILAEEGDFIRDHPGDTTPEVHDLVHHEGHDSRGEHVVLHVRIPCCPSFLEDVEVYIVMGDFLEVVGVGCR